MAYDGWVTFDGVEVFNIARTAALANALSIETVAIAPSQVGWLSAMLDPSGSYSSVANAPWYDPDFPASAEFAGVIPLGLPGLDSSTASSTPVEYVTDGGNPGRVRNTTLAIVANVVLVASSERGAEFGFRWLSRTLSANGATCFGVELEYLRYAAPDAPPVHRRNVKMTRGISVTRKRSSACSATWMATFTLTAGDPFEYGNPISKVTALGPSSPTGPGVIAGTSAVSDLVSLTAPVYDFSPLQDPLYPSLVAPATVPEFFPAGWGVTDGTAFRRYSVKVTGVEPSGMRVVPKITLRSSVAARTVRVGVWGPTAGVGDQWGALFSSVVRYLPVNQTLYLDGEAKAAYAWDGASPAVRRAEGLALGPTGAPIEWTAFPGQGPLLVTLDCFAASGGGFAGGGNVRMTLDLIEKSD